MKGKNETPALWIARNWTRVTRQAKHKGNEEEGREGRGGVAIERNYNGHCGGDRSKQVRGRGEGFLGVGRRKRVISLHWLRSGAGRDRSRSLSLSLSLAGGNIKWRDREAPRASRCLLAGADDEQERDKGGVRLLRRLLGVS